MKQVTRNEQIDVILKKIDAQFAYDMGVTLESYISKLENNQKVIQLDANLGWDTDNPPIWSQARVEKRAQRRYERMAKKRSYYQSTKP